MFDAFANREDVGIGSPHLIVDNDAALDVKPGICGDARLRPYSRGHHDEIGRIDRAVIEQNGLGMLVAENGFCLCAAMDFDAAAFQFFLQQTAGAGIELPLHEMAHQMQHRHVHAARFQPGRSLDPEKSAAKHNGIHAGPSGNRQHRIDVIEVAERRARPAIPCQPPE